MASYRVNHRYGARKDGVQYGPWQPGATVDLTEAEAAWFNRDSAGVLSPVEEAEKPPPAAPVVTTLPVADAPPVVDASAAGPGPAEDPGPEVVPDGTAPVVLAWVHEDPDRLAQRARLALDVELGKGDGARKLLVTALERLAGERQAAPGRDRMHRGGQNR